MNDLIQTVAVYALPVLFAITLHEAAHAYAAKFFGDNTAYAMGRMTLDPLKHTDLFGTIIIPIVLYVATGGRLLFGYAKPVPINYGHLRKPKRDMAFVAAAGPMANLLMALIWTYGLYFVLALNVESKFLFLMMRAGILTNLVMMAFNLFPIPPLDGGRVLVSLLPRHLAYRFEKIEPYGFFIVMGLVLLGVLYSWWMYPLMGLMCRVLALLSPLPYGWLASVVFGAGF